MRAKLVAAAVVAALSISTAVSAAPLVTNGGFEKGSFTGWDQFGDISNTAVYRSGQTVGTEDLKTDAGTYSAAFGPVNGGGITQTFETTPGQMYHVSFDLANTDQTANNSFQFSFDDGYQVEQDNMSAFDFTRYVYTFAASAPAADVTFLFQNPNGHFLLDKVSVAALPEPATWAMLLTGFLAIGVTMRRRTLTVA